MLGRARKGGDLTYLGRQVTVPYDLPEHKYNDHAIDELFILI